MVNKVIFILTIVIGVGFLSGCGYLGLDSTAEVVRAQIDPNQPLTLEFSGSRIRVEAWDESYVEIDPVRSKVKNPVEISVEGNAISFDYEKHLASYPGDLDRIVENVPASREVYFVIRVPRQTPVQIISAGLNARDNCLIQSIQTRMASVRECRLVDGFVGMGETFYMRDITVGANYSLQYNKIMKWVGHGRGHWSEI